ALPSLSLVSAYVAHRALHSFPTRRSSDLSSPPPYYNFEQVPLVRGLDPLWIEKVEGDGTMSPGEPLDDVHMPNGSLLPFLMGLGFFVAGFGFIYQTDYNLAYLALYDVMAFAIGFMVVHSLKDDYGYYIPKEELQKALEREAK